MKLPNASRAVIDESKVVRYLLSALHPDGRSKATFFASFGFRLQRWDALAQALRDHGNNGEVAVATRSDYGARYTVDGIIAVVSQELLQ